MGEIGWGFSTELLMSATGDLLYRVRIYDRDLLYSNEIMDRLIESCL
jgi:hypothetical protein